MSSANPTYDERLADLREAIDAGVASGDAGPLDIEAFLAELRTPKPYPERDIIGEWPTAPKD